MADKIDCGDFGVTYGCKYVIYVKKISTIEQRSYLILVVFIHCVYFCLLFGQT